MDFKYIENKFRQFFRNLGEDDSNLRPFSILEIKILDQKIICKGKMGNRQDLENGCYVRDVS